MTAKRTGYHMSHGQAQKLADSLARALNAAEIPCVLWGHYLLSAHGVPTFYGSLDFVVPDASLAAAIEAIMTTTHPEPLVPCPDTTTCIKSEPELPTPHPAFHVHIEGVTHSLAPMAVSLFVQSETLWFLPPFSASLTRPRENPLPRYFALVSDLTALPPRVIRKEEGAWDLDQTVVVVPKAHILLEALMRIMARDTGKQVGAIAPATWAYIDIYVQPLGFLDVELLPEPFATAQKGFVDGKIILMDLVRMLRRAMGIPVEEDKYD